MSGHRHSACNMGCVASILFGKFHRRHSVSIGCEFIAARDLCHNQPCQYGKIEQSNRVRCDASTTQAVAGSPLYQLGHGASVAIGDVRRRQLSSRATRKWRLCPLHGKTEGKTPVFSFLQARRVATTPRFSDQPKSPTLTAVSLPPVV